MLKRVNAALFEAPVGAPIQVVAGSRNNDGVTDARFEYAGHVLPRETIAGLPGCSFTVMATTGRLQAVVVFDPDAPGTARYDLFEVENGVLSSLGKFTLKSDVSPLIAFAIEPTAAAVAIPASGPMAARPSAARTRAPAKKRTARPRKKRTARPKKKLKPPKRKTTTRPGR